MVTPTAGRGLTTLALPPAEALVHILRDEGVDRVFGNPGTTELPLLEALSAAGIEYVLGVQEASVVSMADGYARTTGRTAVVSLHAAGGTANGLVGLLNAKRSRIPLVVFGGQQDRRHLQQDPMLAGDLVGLARPATKAAYDVQHARDLPLLLRRAFAEARRAPAGPVYLAVPMDVLQELDPVTVPARSAPATPGVADLPSVRAAAELLAGAMSPAIVAGDGVGRDGAVDTLVALAETLGATVHHQPMHDGLDFPYPHPLHGGVLPSTNAGVRDALRGHDVVLVAGCHAFNPHHYTDADPIPAGTAVIQLDDDPAEPGRNFPAAVALTGGIGVTLGALTSELMGSFRPSADGVLQRTRAAARRTAEQAAALTTSLRDASGRGTDTRLDPLTAVHAIVRGLPSQAVLVEEAITSGVLLRRVMRIKRPGSFLHTMGGGLGHGTGLAVGAALGSPGRPVVCVLGDGCTLFGLQGLWSAARQHVPVTFVVMNNGEYRTLKETLDGWSSTAHGADGRYPGLDLDPPQVDFQAVARAFDLRAVRVSSPAELTEAVAKSAALDGPVLVEVPITGHATGVAAD